MSNQEKVGASEGVTDGYEGMRTRARWKPSDAERVLSDWASSGMPMAAFAREHGLGLHRLLWWRERLKQTTTAGKPTTRLVPATVRRAPLISVQAPSHAAAVVVSAAGVRVEIADPLVTDPRWIAAVVRALDGERA